MKIIGSDESALKVLIKQFTPMVMNCCANFLHNHSDAEDVSQETFIEVYYSINKFKYNSSLKTWIYRIAVNKCIDFIRKKNRKKRFGGMLSFLGSFSSNEENLLQTDVNPQKLMESNELTAIIFGEIQKLPENQRICLTLSKIDDLSYKEIAEIMNVSVSAVEGLVHRSKTNLRNALNKNIEFQYKYGHNKG